MKRFTISTRDSNNFLGTGLEISNDTFSGDNMAKIGIGFVYGWYSRDCRDIKSSM